MSANEGVRGTAGRTTVIQGNPGTLVGTQDVGGAPYARYRATPGTWVSASLKEQGYGPAAGYGAYAGLVRSPDGTPLSNPDRIAPGQEYLVPLRGHTTAPQSTAKVNAPAEAARGIADRYAAPPAARPAPPPVAGVSRGAAAAPLLALPALRVDPGIARSTLTALEEAAARWGGAEVVRGGGTAVEGGAEVIAGEAAAEGGVALGWWLLPLAAWGFAGYELLRLYTEIQSAEQAKQDSEALRRQLRQAVHTNWQNGIVTDDEYFLYMATGVLVIQPREGGGAPTGAAASSSKDSRQADNLWFKLLIQGINYNKAHAFDYPFREVYVDRYDGKPGYFRVDFFAPGEQIVSQKFTQLADIQEATAIGYLEELAKKYAPGTKIAAVDSSEGVLRTTKVLTGRLILQVPVQRHPVPQRIIETAIKLKITIRDDFGNKFTVGKKQFTASFPGKVVP